MLHSRKCEPPASGSQELLHNSHRPHSSWGTKEQHCLHFPQRRVSLYHTGQKIQRATAPERVTASTEPDDKLCTQLWKSLEPNLYRKDPIHKACWEKQSCHRGAHHKVRTTWEPGCACSQMPLEPSWKCSTAHLQMLLRLGSWCHKLGWAASDPVMASSFRHPHPVSNFFILHTLFATFAGITEGAASLICLSTGWFDLI